MNPEKRSAKTRIQIHLPSVRLAALAEESRSSQTSMSELILRALALPDKVRALSQNRAVLANEDSSGNLIKIGPVSILD